MLDLREFAEKNGLLVSDPEDLARIELAVIQGEPVGYVCQGATGGMVPAGIEALGVNTIFPYGIYVSCRKETPCEKATVTLIPRALCLGITATGSFDVQQLENAAGELLSRLGFWKEALGSAAADESLAGNPALRQFCEKYDLELKLLPQSEWEQAVEPLSETDILIGKQPDDADCEKLARCGTDGGMLQCRQTDFGPVHLALAMEPFTVVFEET